MADAPIYPNFRDTAIVNAPTPSTQTGEERPMSVEAFYNSSMSDLYKNNPYLNDLVMTKPIIETPVNQTLRYTDPIYGYNALDPNQEQEYADRQGLLPSIGNTLVKSGANLVSGVIETFAAIPYTVAGIMSGKPSLAYNNDLINYLDEFKTNMDTALPNYVTQYQKDHPFLSAFNPLHLQSFTNTWGNVLQGLGSVAGTIIGSAAIDAGIGALTGGAGVAALLPAQAERTALLMSRLGNIAGKGEQVVNSFGEALAAGEDVAQAVNKAYATKTKLDAFRYGFGVFNSALAQSIPGANMMYKTTLDDKIKEYQSKFGTSPGSDELSRMESYAAGAGNTNLLINTAAFTFLNDRMLGSFFKNSNQAIKQGVEAEIASGTKPILSPENIDLFTLAENQTKTTGFKGIISNPSTTKLAKDVGEQAGFGALLHFTDSSIKDFVNRKYNDENISNTDNALKSIANSIGDTFLTQEGLQGIFTGALNGVLIHAAHSIQNRLSGAETDRDKLAQESIRRLNNVGVTSLFEHAYDGAVNADGITKDMQHAIEEGDVFKYRNLKHEQLFNYVNSAAKGGHFEARIDQLNALKDLTQQQFETLFQLKDTEVNRRTVGEYVDGLVTKAQDIRGEINKVDKVFTNPYHYVKNHDMWRVYEDYKDALSLSLSKIKDNKNRIQDLGNEISNIKTNFDVDKIVNLTNDLGIKQTVQSFNDRIRDLKENEKLVESEPRQQAVYAKERKFLEDQAEFLNRNLVDNKPEEYISGVKDILNYYSNLNNVEGHDNLSLTDTLESINKGQDIWKLKTSSDMALEYYNTLVKKDGFKDFAQDVLTATTPEPSRIIRDENGNFIYRTKAEIDREAKERQERENEEDIDKIESAIKENNPSEDITPEQDAQLKEIIKKEKNGEQLTDEEAELKKEKPNAFENKKKAVAKKEKLDKKTAEKEKKDLEDEEPFSPVEKKPEAPIEQTKAPATKISDGTFTSVSPVNTLFRALTADRADGPKQYTNLHDALFSPSSDFKFADSLSLEVSKSTKGKTAEDFSHIRGTNFYRRGYDTDIEIMSNGKSIGQLQDGLYFKRGSEYIPVSEINEGEYEKITGNDPETFDRFSKNARDYQNMINGIKSSFARGKKEFSKSEFQGMIDKIKLAYDPIYANTDADSTLLKDIRINKKDSVVLSFPVEKQSDGTFKRTQRPSIITERGVEENKEAQDFIDLNLDKLRNFDRRYIVLFKNPNGEFDNKSIFVGRPTPKDARYMEDILYKIKSGDKSVSEDLGDVYIADSMNKNSGSSMRLSLQDDGALRLRISNSRGKTKYVKELELSKEELKGIDSVKELTDALTDKIVEASKTKEDAKLRRLNIKLQPSDFKSDIIEDQYLTLEGLQDKLKVATHPDVYENQRFFIYPKGIEETQIVGKEPITEKPENLVETPSEKTIVEKSNEAEKTPSTVEEKPEPIKTIKNKEDFIGKTLESKEGDKYEIKSISDKGDVQYIRDNGARGFWSKDQLDRKVREGELKYNEKAPVAVIETVGETLKEKQREGKPKEVSKSYVISRIGNSYRKAYRQAMSEKQEIALKNADVDFDMLTGKLSPSFLQQHLGISISGAVHLSDLIGKVVDNSEFYKTIRKEGVIKGEENIEEYLHIPQNLRNFVTKNLEKIRTQLQNLGEKSPVSVEC